MRAILIIAAAGVAAGSAAGDQFDWTWNRGDPGSYSLNDSAGRYESIVASFDTTAQTLSWSLTFSNQITDGLTLALDNGPNPKGHAGELALLYLDASDRSNLELLAYGYNGKNSRNSFRDGDGNTSGDQTPDVIHDAGDTSWINSLSVTDTIDGKRIFDFSIDTTVINNHTPMYPDATDPWFGVGWGEKLGLWLHTYKNLNSDYNGDDELTRWDRSAEGWFDGTNFDTEMVPLPGSAAMALVGLAGVGCSRRRR